MSTRILLVDDDTELCELLRAFLEPEGFEVEACHDGLSGLEAALSGRHALVILDVMLPGLQGFEVLRRIRASSRIPVLMLTARGDDVDRIVGLEMGADDYLPKPFNPREMVARIRAIQRRVAPSGPDLPAARRLEVGDVVLDPATRQVTQAGSKVSLTAVEFSLLEILLRQAGQVVSRDDLYRQVLGREASPLDRSIDVHVSNLRKKLGPGPADEERIQAVRGVGYIYTSLGTSHADDAADAAPGYSGPAGPAALGHSGPAGPAAPEYPGPAGSAGRECPTTRPK
ncbi:MAG: response regulator transcription factor [Polyangia bacterium]|jgi:two-component system response regulator CpxR|nr:response regulator transcription factor [Polyangia bacterium]